MFKSARTAALRAVLLLMLALFGRAAFADTYSITKVLSTQNENFAGGDDYGNYTINITNAPRGGLPGQPLCGSVVSAICYETHYVNSSVPVFTTVPPTLWADPNPIAGTEDCSLYIGNRNVLCNNGHALYSGFLDLPNGGITLGIFLGADPDPLTDFLFAGSIDGGFMTPNGNAYFIDGINNTLDVAINLSTRPVPEPQSLLLLGTGGILLAQTMRRRITRST